MMKAEFVDNWLDPFVNEILVVSDPGQNLREIPAKTLRIAPKTSLTNSPFRLINAICLSCPVKVVQKSLL